MDTSDENSGPRFEENHNLGQGKGGGPGSASISINSFPFQYKKQAKASCFASSYFLSFSLFSFFWGGGELGLALHSFGRKKWEFYSFGEAMCDVHRTGFWVA